MLKSIKTRLIVINILLVLIVVVGLSFFSYNQSRDILEDNLLNTASILATQNAELINEWLLGSMNEVLDVAQSTNIKSMSWWLQQDYLQNIVEHQDDVEDIIIADLNGNFNATSGATGSIKEREYFQKVINTGEPTISDVLVSEISGDKIIVIAGPIMDVDDVVGVLCWNLKLDHLIELLEGMKLNGYGTGWIINNKMQTIAHPDRTIIGKSPLEYIKAENFSEIISEMVAGKSEVDEYLDNGVETLIAYAPINLADWSIAFTAKSADLLSPVNVIKRGSLILGIIAFVIGLVVAVFVAYYIANPITRMSKVADIVASGDLTHKVEIKNEDELGSLARSFNKMVDNLRTMISNVSEVAKETASNSQQLSASTEETSASIEEVSSSAQQFFSTVEQLNENSQEMAREASNVNELSNKGINEMENTRTELQSVLVSSEQSRDSIVELNKASEEISSIVDVISGIADQTNLLALNAAIEAARAGEHGRGFAVVADEVRELAEESQKSAGNIKELIGGLIEKTRHAVEIIEKNKLQIEERVKAVDNTAEMFRNIAERINNLVSKIEEIAAATQQLSSGSEEISAATEEQSASIQQVSGSAQELAGMARELSNLISKFKL